MIMLLSPAKRVATDAPAYAPATQPQLLQQAVSIAQVLKTKSVRQLQNMMDLSKPLGELNYQRYQAWSTPFTKENAHSAMYLFQGDVYIGLDAAVFSPSERTFAQQHLRILSGLYGILRPLDLIQPYRLMMGTKTPVNTKKSLYTFWGDEVTQVLIANVEQNHKRLSDASNTKKYIVNLASQEYSKVVNTELLQQANIEFITVQFKHKRMVNNKPVYKNLGVLSKKARGMLARYAIMNSIEEPLGLRNFTEAGYSYNTTLSSEQEWIFTNEQ